MSDILSIDAYTPKSDDLFYFDTMIWSYLYCMIGNYNEEIVEKYSNFLKKIIKSKSIILISSLGVSEFINTYLRLEFNILKDKDCSIKDFKRDFRGSYEYKNILKDVKRVVNFILKLTQRVNDNFENINLDKILNNCEKIDYNDSYYIYLLENQNIKFVTHDSDFAKVKNNFTILSTNTKLLSKR